MINIKNLVHRYTIWESDTKKSKKTVLDDVTLDISPGQMVAVLGPNGSGKSTLAKHLNVLLLPDEGTVWIDGKDTKDVGALWNIRSNVGMVFQNPDNQIVGTSVEEDVAFGPENKNLPSEIIQERVADSLRAVGLLHKEKVLRSACRADKNSGWRLPVLWRGRQSVLCWTSLRQCWILLRGKK